MNHSISSFSASDGLKIHTESWLPDGDVKAAVVIVHGYDEYVGRYSHVAAKLTENGYAVYGLDHRGHGKSEGPRVYTDRFSRFSDDLKQYFDTAKAGQQGKPIFLYGHSMGSVISLSFALHYPDELAGLIISGCAITADEAAAPLLVAVGKFMARIIPKVHFQPLDPNGISRDPEIVAAYKADPLVSGKAFRFGVVAGMVNECEYIREYLSKITLPLLILHGSEDYLTPPSGGERLNEKAASVDKTLKMYEGLYHEVHNEPEKETVLGDIVEWLDAHS